MQGHIPYWKKYFYVEYEISWSIYKQWPSIQIILPFKTRINLKMQICPSINCFLNEQYIYILCFAAVLCTFVLSCTAIFARNYCKLRRLSPEGRMKARIITNRCESFIQSQLEITDKNKILRLVWISNFYIARLLIVAVLILSIIDTPNKSYKFLLKISKIFIENLQDI